jgi:hypothetical protein
LLTAFVITLGILAFCGLVRFGRAIPIDLAIEPKIDFFRPPRPNNLILRLLALSPRSVILIDVLEVAYEGPLGTVSLLAHSHGRLHVNFTLILAQVLAGAHLNRGYSTNPISFPEQNLGM